LEIFMRFRTAFVVIAFFGAATTAGAQHGTPVVAGPGTAPREVSQYDFLVGDWDLKVQVPATSLATKVHGMPKLVGTWKVRKGLDGWGLEDDLRITDIAGNPASMAHAIRYYDRATKRWIVSALEVYRGRFSTATGQWNGKEMVTTSVSKDADGKPIMLRTRVFNITPTSFSYQQDKSDDNGKSWDDWTLKIQAKRAGSR
jgi:hypothetical protein